MVIVVVPISKLPVTVKLAAVAVPVNAGLAIGALAFKALVDAVLRGFNKSVVLSTSVQPTIALLSPPTLPVKVGLAIGALAFKAFD